MDEEATGLDITPLLLEVIQAAVSAAHGGKTKEPLDRGLCRRKFDRDPSPGVSTARGLAG